MSEAFEILKKALAEDKISLEEFNAKKAAMGEEPIPVKTPTPETIEIKEISGIEKTFAYCMLWGGLFIFFGFFLRAGTGTWQGDPGMHNIVYPILGGGLAFFGWALLKGGKKKN